MPVTLKAANVKYKSAITGEYVGVNSVSDNTTAEQIASIETAGQQQINAVVAQGQATIASIPVDYTNLSNEVTDLKSAIESRIDFLLLEQGGINLSGAYTTSDYRVRTKSKIVHPMHVDTKNNDILIVTPEPSDIASIMDKIRKFDQIMTKFKGGLL